MKLFPDINEIVCSKLIPSLYTYIYFSLNLMKLRVTLRSSPELWLRPIYKAKRGLLTKSEEKCS